MHGSFFPILFLFISLLPLIHVLISDRSHGGAKFGWVLIVLIFNLIGYAAFLILTQRKADSKGLSKRDP